MSDVSNEVGNRLACDFGFLQLLVSVLILYSCVCIVYFKITVTISIQNTNALLFFFTP